MARVEAGGAWPRGDDQRFFNYEALVNLFAERKGALIEAAICELDRLAHLPALQAQLRDKAERRVKQFKSQTRLDVSDIEQALAKVNVNVHRLLTFIQETDEKDPGVLDAVRPALEEAVGKQQSLKARLEALQEQRPDSRVPTVEEIVGLSQDVKARLTDDPLAGRELLRYMLLDGKVTLTPNEDGSYTAASTLIWARVAWKTRKPRGGSGPSGASGASHEVVGNDGCAGRI